ncbi:MAG: substrate-binding domain-containing protein [Chloroflexota bacterium]
MPHVKSRREFLKLSAMASMSMMLASCATANSDESSPRGQESEIEIVVWFKDVRTVHELTEELLATEFRDQNPGINPKVQFVPNRQGLANLKSSHAAGEAPDIFFPARAFIQAILQLGMMHPIPEGIIDVRAEMGERVADFYQLPDGHYYVLPTGNMPACLYYNIDLLEANGYTPEDIPTTWDEFIPWAKALTIWEGDTVTQAGFTFNGEGLWLADAIRYQNGGWWFIDDKTCAWAEPETTDAYQFVLDLFAREHLQDRNGLPSSDQFSQGKAVTGFSRTFQHGLLISGFPDLNWGTVPTPTQSGEGPFGRATDETGFVVTTQSDDERVVDASWAVWRYLVGESFQRRYIPIRGRQPSLRALWDDPAFSADDEQWRGIAISTIPGNFRNPGIWPAEVSMAIVNTWTRVREEGESIDVVLADACREVDEVLTRQDNWPLIIGKTKWETNPLWETLR